jgi:hypothetical protein
MRSSSVKDRSGSRSDPGPFSDEKKPLPDCLYGKYRRSLFPMASLGRGKVFYPFRGRNSSYEWNFDFSIVPIIYLFNLKTDFL